MNQHKDEIGQQAVQTTTAFNPVVGAQFSELLKSAVYVTGQAARHPHVVGGHFLDFLRDASRIVLGDSDLKPDPKDRRFTDVTWTNNPLYR